MKEFKSRGSYWSLRRLAYLALGILTSLEVLLVFSGYASLAVSALYLYVPISAALLFLTTKSNQTVSSMKLKRHDAASFSLRTSRKFWLCVGLFLHFFLLSIAVLFLCAGRTLFFAVLLGVSYTVIILQIVSVTHFSVRVVTIILAEIVAILLLSILSSSIYPFYFGWGDVPWHTGLIDSILNTGHITSDFANYEFFPLFHIFSAQAVSITGFTGYPNSSFVITLAYALSPILIFLIGRSTTQSTRMGLVIAGLFAAQREIIFNGSYLTPRSMALVMFILLLAVLFLQTKSKAHVAILAVILCLALVVTHNLSLLYIAGSLILLCAIAKWIRKPLPRHIHNLSLLLVVVTLAYWFYVAVSWTSSTIRTIRDTDVPVAVASSTASNPFIFLALSIDLSVMAFLATIPIMIWLSGTSKQRRFKFGALSAMGAILAPLYFYGPLSLVSISQPLLLLYRIPLFIAPAFVIFAAEGFLHFGRIDSHGRVRAFRLAAIVSLSMIIGISSIANGLTGSDIHEIRNADMRSRPYFMSSEMSALQFSQEHTISKNTYADFYAYRYLHGENAFPLTFQDLIQHSAGLYVVREEEFFHGQLLLYGGSAGFAGVPQICKSPDCMILDEFQSASRIYDNPTVTVFFFD